MKKNIIKLVVILMVSFNFKMSASGIEINLDEYVDIDSVVNSVQNDSASAKNRAELEDSLNQMERGKLIQQQKKQEKLDEFSDKVIKITNVTLRLFLPYLLYLVAKLTKRKSKKVKDKNNFR